MRPLELQEVSMSRTLVLAAFAAVGLAGCASSGDAVEERAYDKVYRTGSNLPTRENAPTRNTTLSPDAVSDPVRLPGGLPTRGPGN
jgi:type IV pilus biogenesis protein CpaD/CtpE